MGGMGIWGGSLDRPPPPDYLKQRTREFFDARDAGERQELLLAAYQEAEKEGASLVSALLEAQGHKELENGLAEIEIELKLTVPRVGDLESTLTGFRLNPKKQDRFLQGEYAQKNKGANHYFGTSHEERFIVIENKGGWHIKLKGQAQPYSFGIPGEKFVLRRTESIKQLIESGYKGDLLSFVKLIVQECAPTEVRYLGRMEKDKATQFVIERTTGRVYSITLGVCTADKHEPLRQLEIEYAGHVPDFPGQKQAESEQKIIEDILFMTKQFEEHGLTPTTLTKFEWLVGKTPEPGEKKATRRRKKRVLSADQVFFDDSV